MCLLLQDLVQSGSRGGGLESGKLKKKGGGKKKKKKKEYIHTHSYTQVVVHISMYDGEEA